MHRQFAGILGATAFVITVVQATLVGGGAAGTLPRATVLTAAFTLLGAIVGRLALWTVDEGVAAQLHRKLTEKKS